MKAATSLRWLLVAGLALSVVMAGAVAFYASSSPDGLEFVAGETGFAGTAQDSAVAGSPLADYGVAGVEDERLSLSLAGIVGVVVTAILGFGLFLLIRAGRRGRSADLQAHPAGEPLSERG